MYRLWKRISTTAGIAWSLIDKTGSNITDIVTRNHADLQNLNTTNYTHLTSAQAADIMYRATYDADLDGVADNAESVNIHVRNSTGSMIPKGSAVYISGATGQMPTVTLAKADSESTSSKTLGLISANLNNNANGYAINIGRLAQLDTSMFGDGDTLWLSATTAGAIVNTAPTQPNHAVFIGYCAYSQNNNGILIVNIQNGYELNELHNVLITTPSNGQALVYESATSLWKNSTVSVII